MSVSCVTMAMLRVCSVPSRQTQSAVAQQTSQAASAVGQTVQKTVATPLITSLAQVTQPARLQVGDSSLERRWGGGYGCRKGCWDTMV